MWHRKWLSCTVTKSDNLHGTCPSIMHCQPDRRSTRHTGRANHHQRTQWQNIREIHHHCAAAWHKSYMHLFVRTDHPIVHINFPSGPTHLTWKLCATVTMQNCWSLGELVSEILNWPVRSRTPTGEWSGKLESIFCLSLPRVGHHIDFFFKVNLRLACVPQSKHQGQTHQACLNWEL